MWKWFQAARGIRYRKHASRKHGARLDRYFVIRHSVDGTQIDEPLGWGSDGWTVERAKAELSRLQEAKRTGKGPTMLRAEAEANREPEQRRAEEEAAEARRQKTVADLWDRYSKEVMAIEKRPRTLPPYPTPSAARLSRPPSTACRGGQPLARSHIRERIYGFLRAKLPYERLPEHVV